VLVRSLAPKCANAHEGRSDDGMADAIMGPCAVRPNGY